MICTYNSYFTAMKCAAIKVGVVLTVFAVLGAIIFILGYLADKGKK